MDVLIDRCYCFDTKFSELKKVVGQSGATTVAELQREVTFGEQCHLCHPYVRRMLRTGAVVFREVIEDERQARP